LSKVTGLGDNCYIGGFDLSGDIGSLGGISTPVAMLDVTGINKSAYERLPGLRDGSIAFSSFFNTSTGQEHAVLKTLPRTDVVMTYCRGTTLGNPAACMVGKQINYDGTRANDGAFTMAVSAQANAFGMDWGQQLTAGKRTDTAATSGTGVSFATDDPYAAFTGVTGAYIATPDAASISVTGDIDIRAKLELDNWTPATAIWPISKASVSGTSRSYSLSVQTSGVIQITWSADGSTLLTKNSTVATGFVNGSTHWIRVTLDVDNTAAGNDVKFYTSLDGHSSVPLSPRPGQRPYSTAPTLWKSEGVLLELPTTSPVVSTRPSS
jgi:hypothetical protein